MSWKYVQYDGETGKKRTVEGTSSSTLANLEDTNISSPSDGQILRYDNASSKWVNSNPRSGHIYSTTEQVVGTWIDGKPIYEIVLQADTTSSATVYVGITSLNVATPLTVTVFGRCQLNGTDYIANGYYQDSGDGINTYILSDKSSIVVRSKSNYPRGPVYLIFRYTKNTN